MNLSSKWFSPCPVMFLVLTCCAKATRHRDTVKTWKSAGRGLSVTCSEGIEESREGLRGCVLMGVSSRPEGGAVRLKSNRDDPSGGRQDSPMDGLRYSEMTKIKFCGVC